MREDRRNRGKNKGKNKGRSKERRDGTSFDDYTRSEEPPGPKDSGNPVSTADNGENGENGENLKIAEGILEDAEREARKVIAEAEKAKAERVAAATAQTERIRRETERNAEDRLESISRQADSAVTVAIRRSQLKSRETFLRKAGEGAAKRMAKLIDEPQYREILVRWIAEAAAGLNTDAAVVNASSRERGLIDEDVLHRASEQARELTGRLPVLSVSTDPPLPEQGVMLFAADGRTAYDNRVSTRMRRYNSEIRTIVYEGLKGE